MRNSGKEWRFLRQRLSNKDKKTRQDPGYGSGGKSETAGDDDVDLQAVGAGPPQADQKAVNQRVQ